MYLNVRVQLRTFSLLIRVTAELDLVHPNHCLVLLHVQPHLFRCLYFANLVFLYSLLRRPLQFDDHLLFDICLPVDPSKLANLELEPGVICIQHRCPLRDNIPY